MSSLSTIPTTEPVLVDEVKPPLPVSAPSSSSSASSSSADACAGAGGELAKECPIPLPTEPIKSLSDLVAALQDGFAKGLKKEDKETYLKALLSLYDQSSCPERARFTLWSDSKLYTRNLIAEDENFSLMLLCWNGNCFSPVHDHPTDSCAVKCLEGTVQEVRYSTEVKDGPLEVLEDVVAVPGDVLYIDDSQALHKVGNPGTVGAVTLHIYSPPFDKCKVWLNEEDGSDILEPVCTFYSEHGERVEYD